jgi:Tfp pilus assembly protein PilN
MIRINLARERKNGGGTRFDLKNFNFQSLLAAIKPQGGGDGEQKKLDLKGPLPKAVMAAVVCWLVDDTLTTYRTEQLAVLDKEIAELESQQNAIQAKLSKIKGFEPIKKQLQDDEIAIKTKLDVVTKLLESRNAPSKMMMQVANAIPDEVWLTSLRVTADKLTLVGSAIAYNNVSDFIKALNGTSQFTDINLSGIQEATNTNSKDTQKYQSFELSAKRRDLN